MKYKNKICFLVTVYYTKALASTSATPGHTKHFHFFNVNKDRKDVPPFCFVDVPGLGNILFILSVEFK